jgi:hypothetical protein
VTIKSTAFSLVHKQSSYLTNGTLNGRCESIGEDTYYLARIYLLKELENKDEITVFQYCLNLKIKV